MPMTSKAINVKSGTLSLAFDAVPLSGPGTALGRLLCVASPTDAELSVGAVVFFFVPREYERSPRTAIKAISAAETLRITIR